MKGKKPVDTKIPTVVKNTVSSQTTPVEASPVTKPKLTMNSIDEEEIDNVSDVSSDGGDYVPPFHKESRGDSRKGWINIDDQYVLSREFLESCVIYVQRSGSAIVIRTVEEQADMTITKDTVAEAVSCLRAIHKMLNTEDIESLVEYDDVTFQ